MTIKQIDPLGRIVIPKNIRDQLHLSPNSSVLMKLDPENQEIILQKEKSVCCICGKDGDLIQKSDLLLCPACLKKIKD